MIPVNRRNNFANLWSAFDDPFFTNGTSTVPFRVDLQDRGDAFTLTAELPGFDRQDIKLRVQAGVLTIQADHAANEEKLESGWILRERHAGSYSRSFTLTDIQEDAITATYQNGLLTLNLPKQKPAAPKQREIIIQ
jgi:HSP20 family protein